MTKTEETSKTNSTEERFLDLLKKKCSKCKKSTLVTYYQAAKRLYKLKNEGDIPTTSKWLKSPALFETYSKLPVNIRRHLSTAAVKIGQALNIKNNDSWYKAMLEDQGKYQTQRNKNLRSKTEEKLMLKGGIKDIKKASTELKKRIKYIIKEPPSKAGLYKYQMYLVIKLFAELPARNDFANIHVEGKTGNFLVIPKKGNIKIIFTDFKNSDRLGPREISLSRAATMALRKFLRYRKEVVSHNFLLSTKSGERLTKSALGKAIHASMMQLVGKALGSRIFRVMHATEHKDILEQAKSISDKMLHSQKQTQSYIRKDKE